MDAEPTDAELTEKTNDWRWTQLGYAVQNRTEVVERVWTVFGHFWTTNAVLLIALCATGKFPDRKISALICVAGVVASIVWWQVQGREGRYLVRFTSLVKQLENDLRVPSKYRLSGRLDERSESWVSGGLPRVSTRKVIQYCCLAVAVLWLVGGVCAVLC